MRDLEYKRGLKSIVLYKLSEFSGLANLYELSRSTDNRDMKYRDSTVFPALYVFSLLLIMNSSEYLPILYFPKPHEA